MKAVRVFILIEVRSGSGRSKKLEIGHGLMLRIRGDDALVFGIYFLKSKVN